ncbi:P2X purinoceptor 3-like [Scyliorhinus canicula]|uniref:P2X purinoceptor 3-like n=1 Tax=Scyliorhinus canicula TaxID=7830 RepID=UPI0018F2FFD4|nr:P2X purinoceptor 3-like [Scyliorhinus canicula]
MKRHIHREELFHYCDVHSNDGRTRFRGKCAEDPDVDNSACHHDDDCAKILGHAVGSGKLTGKCVNFNETVKTCEIQGWCPVELDSTKKVPMIGAENFTIFIKNSIRFPLFNFSKGNMLPSITTDYIRRCVFDAKADLFCPIFRLGNIIAEAGESLSALTRKGGVLGIRIEWKCNLDWSADNCVPRYTFHRMDKVSQTNNVSQGYNFRYARFYRNSSGTEYRTLLKAYGIRIDITVYGQTLSPSLQESSNGSSFIRLCHHHYRRAPIARVSSGFVTNTTGELQLLEFYHALPPISGT